MKKFSWKKINDKFGWNAYSVLEYFYLKQDIPLPNFLSRKVPEKVRKAAALPYDDGPCFVINLNKVLKGAESPSHLYTYLELASKRNIFDYKIRGIRYLPIILVPEYLHKWVEVNPLLKIENNNIYFKYEQE
jgi:hypothetical protein